MDFIVNQKFLKSSRLNKRWEYSRVQKGGTKVYGRYCLMLALPNNTGGNRLGIVITKKVHKRAVIRNRFKRQVREIYRKDLINLLPGYSKQVENFSQKGFLEAPNGLDVVVIARPAAVGGIKTSDMSKDMVRGWKELVRRFQVRDKQ
jgi:ribonuclease P protein component